MRNWLMNYKKSISFCPMFAIQVYVCMYFYLSDSWTLPGCGTKISNFIKKNLFTCFSFLVAHFVCVIFKLKCFIIHSLRADMFMNLNTNSTYIQIAYYNANSMCIMCWLTPISWSNWIILLLHFSERMPPGIHNNR